MLSTLREKHCQPKKHELIMINDTSSSRGNELSSCKASFRECSIIEPHLNVPVVYTRGGRWFQHQEAYQPLSVSIQARTSSVRMLIWSISTAYQLVRKLPLSSSIHFVRYVPLKERIAPKPRPGPPQTPRTFDLAQRERHREGVGRRDIYLLL
jgi:hypothetical protein